jgi:acetoin:2,6-dichlorophenolindophenol oxidoreductase subunit alpha
MSMAGQEAAVIEKRSPDLGLIPRLAERFPRPQTLEIFRKTCVNRHFELEVARVYNTGIIRMPVYLSLGQEHVPAAISSVSTDFQIFAQHRAHSYYLSFGGHIGKLVGELLHRPEGCARGMGGSASIHDPSIGMFGHSGLMGDQVPISVGAALGSGKRVLSVMGDASAEEDYVFSAMGYAATKKLPVLFVCEDNDLSILTHVRTRRSWGVADVARSLGLAAADITDDPWLIAYTVQSLLSALPAYLNIRTCRQLWHAGVGSDGPPEWNRFEMFQDELRNLGLEEEARAIEAEARSLVEKAWQERLQKP